MPTPPKHTPDGGHWPALSANRDGGDSGSSNMYEGRKFSMGMVVIAQGCGGVETIRNDIILKSTIDEIISTGRMVFALGGV